MKVRIKRLDKSIPAPSYKTDGAVAFDLHVREGGEIAPGDVVFFGTGLVIEVPVGHALILASRSSNAKRRISMANGIGVIDQDYCGNEDELHLAIHNLGSESYVVEKGDRVAQGMIIPVPKVEFEEVESMERSNRGGFGTTGR